MAWPPPPLPTDRTDDTSQLANHPADHNDANQAINDITAHVKLSDNRISNLEVLRAFKLIQTGVIAVATNAFGDADIIFPDAYIGVPVVMAMSSNVTIGPFIVSGIGNVTLNAFQVRILDARTGAAYVGSMQVSWIAIGPT